MTNTSKMPWLKEDYTKTKRAFKKRLGLFDKDVAIEELGKEYEEQSRMEDELHSWWEELDERHEREMERRLENQEQDRIEEDHAQRLLNA